MAEVGDEHRLPIARVELPSGRVVSIRMLSDPRRPWRIQYAEGDACTIVRQMRGDCSRHERLKESGQHGGGLVLASKDAEALVAALRSRFSVRQLGSSNAEARSKSS